MSVATRPVDVTTVDYLQLGMPFVEFAHELAAGGYGAYFDLGVINDAEIQKTVDVIQLNDARSGIDELKRELVKKFTGTLQVGAHQHNADNMQIMFASESQTAVSLDATKSVTGDTFSTTSDEQEFIALDNQLVDESTVVITHATITDEVVGVGDGSLGATAGEYATDFKPLAHDDVTAVTVAGVAYAVIAVGAAAASLEVEVTDFADSTADAGDLQFFSAGVAVDVTGEILATYTCTHTYTLNADPGFTTDPINGKVRMTAVGASADALKANQPLLAAYDYNQLERTDLVPFTQFEFKGKLRIRLLTDIGINIVWEIPSASARLTDDAFAFSRDEFGVTPIAIQMLNDGTTAPYGTLQHYTETP